MQSAIPGLPPPPPLVPPLAPSSTEEPTAPRAPRRKIFTEADLAPWFRSEAYAHLQGTILRLTYAVVGRRNDDNECFESAAAKELVRFLDEARARIAQVPLQTSPQRFGNKAFRDWLATVEDAEPALQTTLLSLAPALTPAQRDALAPEARFHLLASFGSPSRLDYGTGHELSFLAYLTVLLRARVFEERDEPALVLRVFRAYIEVVREAQRVFRLEPAGSKGVWGLDDHQHLVYLFGAAQLVGHPTLRPSSILSPASLAPLAPSYLFLSSILHIHTLKRGPFSEHSPLLHQIATTVPSFAKVAKGLWEMYRAEVLAKLPVVQHCRFGALALRWVDKESGEELPSSGDGRADDEGEPAGAGEGDAADAPVITPAPWAAHGAPAAGAGSVRPLAPPTRLGPGTTASTLSAHTTAAFTRRQHPLTAPLPPAPRSFAPPPLFPPRGGGAPWREGGTVADLGGAAAASSPFGVLPRVGLGAGAGAGREAQGVEEGEGGEGTRAPWAE
ncbi:Serine/threonine-protein phosphatase 2A activator 1 [Rhodotorula kratochvilovae]